MISENVPFLQSYAFIVDIFMPEQFSEICPSNKAVLDIGLLLIVEQREGLLIHQMAAKDAFQLSNDETLVGKLENHPYVICNSMP